MAVVALTVLVFGADWMYSRARLGNFTIEGRLDPPTVVADGKQSTVLTVRVTENGRPRAGDLLQCYLEIGNGLFIPEWGYTDQNGELRITYTPNPLTPYDLETETMAHVIDINVGRLIEVDKHFTMKIPVEAPVQ